MTYRKPISTKQGEKQYYLTANKVHPVNMRRSGLRGGIRL